MGEGRCEAVDVVEVAVVCLPTETVCIVFVLLVFLEMGTRWRGTS